MSDKNDSLTAFDALMARLRQCRLCEPQLPLGANPVIRATESARILVAGQAPGVRVHKSGIPFNDPSGDRLREWMGLDPRQFYDESKIAIIPMGFCYPGSGPRGDQPPAKLCSRTWHAQLLAHLRKLRLILAVGQYAQAYYLPHLRSQTLTTRVRNFRDIFDAKTSPMQCQILPLPHPSPRNNLWLKQNPWFEREVVPFLQEQVTQILK